MKIIETFVGALALGLAAMTFGAQAQDKGTGRHRHADQVLAPLDHRRQRARRQRSRTRATRVDLQYAEDDIPNQLAQIENMVTKGAKVLVIAAIDGTTLSDVLQQAADAGVKVIAYDRLIRDSAECRLLHHLRQLRGRRAAGQFAASRASRNASRT